MADTLEPPEPLEPPDPLEPLNPLEPLELPDPLDPLELLNPLDLQEPLEPPEPPDPLEPPEPPEPPELLEPPDPLELLDPGQDEAPLTITSTSPADGVPGEPYAFQLTATGGLPPDTWLRSFDASTPLQAGALPPGLKLEPATGVIRGIPITAGTFGFIVLVADRATPADTATRRLAITVVRRLSIRGLAPPAVEAVAYTFPVFAVGGVPPYRWTLTAGSLPPGLALDATTGVIAGTPAAPGTYAGTVRVDGAEGQTAAAVLVIVVTAALIVDTSALPEAVAGAPYAQTLQATGRFPPFTWAVVAGALPPGLTLDEDTGLISGTPTAAGASGFTVQVSDSRTPAGVAVRDLSITVAPALDMTVTTLPGGIDGFGYAEILQATGGIPPYAWAVVAGELPPGLTLDEDTGLISGAPTATGTYDFTARVRDSDSPPNAVSRALSIVVAVMGITTTALPDAEVGVPYDAPLDVFGGTAPYTWELTSGELPPGLELEPESAEAGAIDGTPTSAVRARYDFEVEVRDSAEEPNVASRALFIEANVPTG